MVARFVEEQHKREPRGVKARDANNEFDVEHKDTVWCRLLLFDSTSCEVAGCSLLTCPTKSKPASLRSCSQQRNNLQAHSVFSVIEEQLDTSVHNLVILFHMAMSKRGMLILSDPIASKV